MGMSLCPFEWYPSAIFRVLTHTLNMRREKTFLSALTMFQLICRDIGQNLGLVV